MSGNAQNFFEKLSKQEVEHIFKKGLFEKCQVSCVEGKVTHIIPVQIVAIDGEKFGRLHVLPQEVYELKDKTCAFSFRLGTRVFFFKAKIMMDGKGFFVEVGFDLLELRRRRHVRFDVPESFAHESYVITSVNKSAKIEALLLNFSESGAKILVKSDLVMFQKGNGVILSLKVGKRATFLVGCQIRFVSRRPKENPEIGLEFVNLTEIKISRILNICEDLSRALVQSRKVKKA